MSSRRNYFCLYGAESLDAKCIEAIEASDTSPEYIRFLVSLGFVVAKIRGEYFTDAFNVNYKENVGRVAKTKYLLRSGPYKHNLKPTNAYEACFDSISAKLPAANRQAYIRMLVLLGFWFETSFTTNVALPHHQNPRHSEPVGQSTFDNRKPAPVVTKPTNSAGGKNSMKNLM